MDQISRSSQDNTPAKATKKDDCTESLLQEDQEAVATKATAGRRTRDQLEATDEDDKKMPSRPLSAYNLFFRDERHNWVRNKQERKKQTKAAAAEHKETQPTMVMDIAQKWKQLDETSKDRYKEMARRESERYKKQMIQYKES